MNNKGNEILIVGKGPAQTEQLKHILDQHGHNAAAAYNGKEALSYLSEHKPQMIISDIVMPEMDGYELCKEIKSDESTMDIPVILLTSLSRPEDVLKGISCGANYFITKSYREDYLISHIEQILANRKISKNEKIRVGVEIIFGGKRHFITAGQQQMLSLLISTYEAAVQRNNELVQTQDELEKLNEHLEELVKERTAELSAEIAIHKRTEERVIKLNRVYAVLRSINQAIVRIHETGQLLKDACRIAIDKGKFQSAWIGIVNYKTKKIEISANAGFAHNLMEVSSDQNPVVSVLRSGKYFVSNNINTDNSLTGIWKQDALSLEFRSFAVFPLIVSGKVIGGFAIYSNEAAFFNKLEISLLDEMAADISFALEYIQEETKRKRVEEALQESEEKYHSLIESSEDSIYLVDKDCNYLYVNNKYLSRLGMQVNQVIGKAYREFHTPEDSKEFELKIKNILKTGKSLSYEYMSLRDNLYFIRTLSPVKVLGTGKPTAVTIISKNITERKLAEELQQKQFEELQTIYHLTNAVGRAESVEKVYDEAMDSLLRLLKADRASIMLFDPGGVMHFKAWRGLSETYRKAVDGHSPWTQDTKAPQPICVKDVEREPSLEHFWPVFKNEGLKALVFIPLVQQGSLLGKFMIYYNTEHFFAENEIQLAQTIASHVAFAIDRKQAEEALQISHKTYLGIMNSLTEAIYIQDENGVFLEVNKTAERFYGYPREYFIGKTLGLISAPGKNDIPMIAEAVKKTFNGEQQSFEFWGLRKNGTIFPKSINLTSGEYLGKKVVIATARDITERKRAEQEIISQKIKFAQLFDNSPIAIALLDNKDKIVFINESFSALFGYYPEEIRGKSLDDLIVPHELKEDAQTYSNETRSGNQVNKESYRKKKDGALVYVQIVGIPVIVNDKTDGIYGMYVDLTQRKKDEEELIKAKEQSEEMNRLKNFFLSNMSHELRTPLISVLGFAELLQQKLNDHEHLEFVNNIIEGGRRLNNTLSGILEISKLEAANSFLNLQQYNLADEIKTRVQSFLPMAQSKQLFLKTELNDTYLNVYIDTELFGKALYHLINNGIKFTKEGGVFVTLNHKRKQGNDWAVTKVIDTGIGIPKKNFEKIFSAFSQLDEGYSKSHEGTGLGLTIAKRIVELMKGYMQVESDVGKGSVFSIWLPAIPNQNQIQQLIEEKQTTTIVKPPTTKEKGLQKVLLVDDNSSNRLFINHCLSAFVRIIEAEDVISGVTTASKVHFDLILIDINLGAGIDGVQAMHEIRKIRGYASVPIIAVTAHAMFRDKERFLNEGFDFYLAKPFTKDALVSLVKKVLAKVKK